MLSKKDVATIRLVLDEKLVNFVTKDEFSVFKEDYYRGQDFVVKKLDKMEHELVSFLGLYRNHDRRIEKLEDKVFNI